MWHCSHREMGRLSHVLLLSLTVALLGGLIFGYELGIISGALLQLKEVFSLSCLQQEILVSALLIGAFVASLIGGIAVDYHGRRNSIILSAVLLCAGSSILLLSSSFVLLVSGRLTVGFAMSISSTACCIYVSEIVSPYHRGKLVSLYEVGVTVGILSAYALNYIWADIRNGWKYMFGLAIGPAAFQGVTVLLLPSTIEKVRSQGDDSQKILLQLHNGEHDDPDSEDANSAQGINQYYSYLDLFRSKDNMRARLLVALGLVLSQQLTGQPNVLYYASTIFRSVGFQSNASAVLASVGLGIVKVVTTVVAMICTDKVGRRTLLIAGSVVMSVSVTVIAFSSQNITMESQMSCRVNTRVNDSYPISNSSTVSSKPILWKPNPTFSNESSMKVQGKQQAANDERMNSSSLSEPAILFVSAEDSLNNTSHEDFHLRKIRSHLTQPAVSSTHVSKHLALNWITLLFMMAFVSAYSIGFGPMTWLVLSEIFPAGIRGRAFAFSSSFNWAANIIVTVTFLDVIDTIGLSGTFLFYGLVGFASVGFICLYLPETMGQSLEEINKHFLARKVSDVRCCCPSINRRGASVSRYKTTDGLLI
ncbi:solute carrier family 2, facilitated glucose transporter member 10 [Stegostoma tigrinum]|uniref:solute carrier family 2, facilitated glucose transporter member 10 n=1 Tax=Stegostoma tigrinum TaxID=3053191 RepID=UPI00202ADD72|nr:solute carrier family 2, facilitated glucose transporter member 10 [Stegostoma tigrinum]XP_048406340.1 solute carrier family 2, facilitated glucose transporter member 10 [Stegostoma tigrinum]XP_048406341.1 solute carrier family 2, facilitated glucose transporter member 10 [Stegostoma tigrinum]XP_048406342.1 solute carrier family 2, facilitated glucose transporter member 10 [Stegostoma tigrinum]XP_059508733.1 solute carrier family 2, facilitated glucose transporter member 10 [Stegostoma tigri